MGFLLGSQTVFQYLNEKEFNLGEEAGLVESKACKNFNLLVHPFNRSPLFIKQESHSVSEHVVGDLHHEWNIHVLIQHYSELHPLRAVLSDAIYFDADHGILIFNYLQEYQDLEEFYTTKQIYPVAIAAALGSTLAMIHHTTLDRHDYEQFLDKPQLTRDSSPSPTSLRLDHLTPEILGTMSGDALKFYRLYQRSPDIGEAIARLTETSDDCCLIHNDLKFNNLLIHQDWHPLLSSPSSFEPGLSPSVIRCIDWEHGMWGEPAVDVGSVVAQYLKLWLKSIPVNPAIDLTLALRLATTPLEQLHPAIVAFLRSYLAQFPECLTRFPDFLSRTMQYAGLALIESIEARLHYYEPFGNTGVALLQVAKVLLTQPDAALPTVLGIEGADLLNQPMLSNEWEPSDYSSPLTPVVSPVQSDSPTSLSSPQRPIYPSDEAILHDIIHNFRIHPTCTITHPDYQSLELPDSLLREAAPHRLQNLPDAIRHRYLKRNLCHYLYDLYISGEQPLIARGETELETLQNDTVRGINTSFVDQLCQNNRGIGYVDSGWLVTAEKQGEYAIQKDELTLYIHPDRHLPPPALPPQIGEAIAIQAPPYRIEPPYYGAIANAGWPSDTAPTLELTFNITAEGAIALMQALTDCLNAHTLPFCFRVLLDPKDYGRLDGGRLQIEQSAYGVVHPLLQQWYPGWRSHFRPQIPLFMKSLAPGIGLAEEPAGDSQDFGLHRCHILADALFETWHRGQDSPEVRLQAINSHLIRHGVDRAHPYRNPQSTVDYTLIA